MAVLFCHMVRTALHPPPPTPRTRITQGLSPPSGMRGWVVLCIAGISFTFWNPKKVPLPLASLCGCLDETSGVSSLLGGFRERLLLDRRQHDCCCVVTVVVGTVNANAVRNVVVHATKANADIVFIMNDTILLREVRCDKCFFFFLERFRSPCLLGTITSLQYGPVYGTAAATIWREGGAFGFGATRVEY